jgi:hypothetical protein
MKSIIFEKQYEFLQIQQKKLNKLKIVFVITFEMIGEKGWLYMIQEIKIIFHGNEKYYFQIMIVLNDWNLIRLF